MKQQNKLKRVLAAILAALILTSAGTSIAAFSGVQTMAAEAAPTAPATPDAITINGTEYTITEGGSTSLPSGVSYDLATNTLTLNGYKLLNTDGGSSGISVSGDLNLVLKGSNQIAVNGTGIDVTGNLTITGSGSLTVRSDAECAIEAEDLVLDGAKVTATGEKNGIFSGSLTISASNVTATGRYAGVVVVGGITIKEKSTVTATAEVSGMVSNGGVLTITDSTVKVPGNASSARPQEGILAFELVINGTSNVNVEAVEGALEARIDGITLADQAKVTAQSTTGPVIYLAGGQLTLSDAVSVTAINDGTPEDQNVSEGSTEEYLVFSVPSDIIMNGGNLTAIAKGNATIIGDSYGSKNQTINLEGYTGEYAARASTSPTGSSAEEYNPDRIGEYHYLRIAVPTPVLNTYTVVFNTNGGAQVAAQSVTPGGKVVEPSTPEKAGYTLEGWYTDEALTQKYDFDTPVTGSMTLYAKWKENTPVTPVNPVVTVEKVTGLKAINKTTTTLKLTFNKVDGADGYEIYDAETDTKLANCTTQNGIDQLIKTITGLKKGETRKYKVRAYILVNGTKIYGEFSDVYTKATACLDQVTGLKPIKKTKTSIKVQFNKVEGATTYKIYNATTGKALCSVTTQKGADVLKKTVTGLKPGTEYKLKVRAFATVNGKSEYGAFSKTITKATIK